MAPGGATVMLDATNSPVLYQNVACDVILIDIPRSIAAAQGRFDTILSTSPLEVPILTKDEYRPSTHKASASKTQMGTNAAQHTEYKTLIEQALATIRSNVSGSWCEPRQLMSRLPLQRDDHTIQTADPERDLELRLREWSAWNQGKGGATTFDLQQMMASLGATFGDDATAATVVPPKWTMSYRPAPSTQVAKAVSQPEVTEPWTCSFCNPETYPLQLIVAERTTHYAQPGSEYRFLIPPRCTFFLGDVTYSDAFRMSFCKLTDEYALPRHFDLVLLDPPWPNRSAKRKGAYKQVGGMPYLKKMLLKLDVDRYLEHNALVGIWITNKEALREHVLGPGGLFEAWNVELIEEWVWIKTTATGEPMFDMDDSMRKPYEILLLGRAAANSWTTVTQTQPSKKRVIAAVPDVHSRKPCLKALLEPLMPDARDYSALEIFSRHLVSGWTCWGNEVLKFNWEKYWTCQEGADRFSDKL